MNASVLRMKTNLPRYTCCASLQNSFSFDERLRSLIPNSQIRFFRYIRC